MQTVVNTVLSVASNGTVA